MKAYLTDNQNEVVIEEFKMEVSGAAVSKVILDTDKAAEEEQEEDPPAEDEEEENFEKVFDDVPEESDKDEDLIPKDKKKSNKKRKKSRYQEEAVEDVPRGKGKRRRTEMDEEKVQDDVMSFMGKLREAVETDRQNLTKKKPAIEKLKMLPLIQKFMANFTYQKAFLAEDGLKLFQDFIKKNKDGTYPPLNQISQMIDILSNLSININHLQNCQIGGYVMEISKNFIHSKQIQKKAADTVEKWSRIVWNINTNYNDIDTENSAYQRVYKKRRQDQENRSDEEEEKNPSNEIKVKKETIYSHARIPKKGMFDFTVKPVSNILDNKTEDLSRLRYSYFDKKNSKK